MTNKLLDILMGREGDDRLYDGKGNDILYAGSGKDILKGGGGADSYYFALADFQNVDVNIVDKFGDNSTANGGAYDWIYLDNKWLSEYQGNMIKQREIFGTIKPVAIIYKKKAARSSSCIKIA